MDDLISRQDAIDALKRMQKDISGDYTFLDPLIMTGVAYIGDCIGEIQDLPSAVKHGRWINHRNDDGHNIADCSECSSTIQWFDDDEKPRYCCMCGARMERKEE